MKKETIGLYESIRDLEKFINLKNNKLRNLKSKMSANEQTEKDRKKKKLLALELMPILKCFETSNDRLIFPDGHRIRIGKVEFRYVEKLKSDLKWNGVIFKYDSSTNIIYYSFESMYLRNKNKSALSVTQDEYDFHPEKLRSYNVIQLLRNYSREEIESIAIYGFRSSVENAEVAEQIENLNKELNSLKSLLDALKKCRFYNNMKDDFIKVSNEITNEVDVDVLDKTSKLKLTMGNNYF